MIATISEILTLKLVTGNSVLRHIDFEYVVITVSKQISDDLHKNARFQI